MSHYLREIRIAIPADVVVARHLAGQMASEMAFPVQRQAEIRLIVSELAQNHLDHCTINGQIRISGMYLAGIPCMMIASFDLGPGIKDVGFLLRPGRHHSTTGLGAGLSSVRRLADSFALRSRRENGLPHLHAESEGKPGTLIAVRCWPDRREPQFLSDVDLDICGLVSPRAETFPCGDDVLISGDNCYVRIAMVDSPGLGSGGKQTRRIARHLHEVALFWPPDQVLEALANDLSGGVSMHILWFDRMHQELHFAGVGNVKTYLSCDGALIVPSGQAVLVDRQRAQFSETKYRLKKSFCWIQHTDGVASSSLDKLATLFDQLHDAHHFSHGDQNLDIAFYLHEMYSKKRVGNDDAAISIGRCQL